MYNKVPEGEVSSAADFILTCLRLDPLERPGAQELEQHQWLKGVFTGSSI